MKSIPAGVRSARPKILLALSAIVAAAALALAPHLVAVAAPPAPVGLWSDSAVPARPFASDPNVTLGLEFSSSTPGQIVGVQYYASGANRAATTGNVWSSDGTRVASVSFPRTSTNGWKTASLTSPVNVSAGEKFIVSYRAASGYAIEENLFSNGRTRTVDALTAYRGTYVYGSGRPTSTWRGSHYFVDVAFVATTSTPTPTPTPTPAPGGFPDASNTGVPSGTTLTAYTGPCSFPVGANVLIDSKDVTAKCGELIANQDRTTLVIRNSVTPRVEMTDPDSASSLSITDSEIRAPGYYEGVVWGGNLTVTRTEVTGGQHSVHCQSNCTIVGSWLHGQYNDPARSFHTNAFITNGGHGIVLRGNTLHCDSILNSNDGGCTADVSLFGDFERVYDVLVEGNYLRANDSSISYCAYGGYQPSKPYPVATEIRYIDNVFERGTNGKCGVYGPVTSFQTTATGNVWSGNRYTDGVPVTP